MWAQWGWHLFWKVKPVGPLFLWPQYYCMVQDILQKLVAIECVKKLITCYSLAKGLLVCSKMY